MGRFPRGKINWIYQVIATLYNDAINLRCQNLFDFICMQTKQTMRRFNYTAEDTYAQVGDSGVWVSTNDILCLVVPDRLGCLVPELILFLING